MIRWFPVLTSSRDRALAHLERFIDPNVLRDDPEVASRARLTILGALGLCSFGVGFVLYFWIATGTLGPVPITILLALPFACATPWLVRRDNRSTTPGAMVCLLTATVLVCGQYFGGGEQPQVLPWLPVVPVLGTLLVSWRFGGLSALVLIVSQVALYLLTRFGHAFPQHATPEPRTLVVVSTCSILVFGAIVGWMYDESRRRSKRELASTLAELRTVNRELITARDRAHAASAAKMQFVANISHELRTPMNGVIGMTDLLIDSKLQAEQRDYAETIRASAGSLLAVIDDVLDFSKLEFNKLELDTVEFDLEGLLDDAVAIVGAQAYDRGIELSLHVAPNLPLEAVGDPVRLRQVLLNLLNNAIKFTEEGEVSLIVSFADTREGRVRFEVRDTGCGIDAELLPRVFDSFYQTDNSPTRRHGGAGLGLAISKHLVELMDGTLSVKSVRHRGSTFGFEVTLLPEGYRDEHDERSRTLQGLKALGLLAANRPWAARALEVALGRDGVVFSKVDERSEIAASLLSAEADGVPYRMVIVDAERDGDLELPEQIAEIGLEYPPAFLLVTEPRARMLREKAIGYGYLNTVTKPLRRAHVMACVASSLRRLTVDLDDLSTLEDIPSQGARVLVAEDNDVNRRLALLMLEKLGYIADAVPDGRAVIEACQQERYDAILMDLQMPLLDGFDTTAAIRALPTEERHTTIIAMSANARAIDRRRSLDAGMNDFLPKPVKLAQLEAVLEQWIFGSVPVPWAESTDSTPLPETPLDRALLESIQHMAGDRTDLFSDLIGSFLDEAPRAIDAMDEHAATEACRALADCAHKMKSSSGNLGAQRLAVLLIRIERAAERKDMTSARSLLTELRKELAVVAEALGSYRKAAALIGGARA